MMIIDHSNILLKINEKIRDIFKIEKLTKQSKTAFVYVDRGSLAYPIQIKENVSGVYIVGGERLELIKNR